MNEEIKRLQELAGLNEIKINNPGTVFNVTEKGKQDLEDFIQLQQLAKKFDVNEILLDEGPESERFRLAQHLDIFSDTRGEDMIKINEPNTLEEYIRRNEEVWGNNETEAKEVLKDFMKIGYITPIKL